MKLSGIRKIVNWFDSYADTESDHNNNEKLNWLRIVPFILLHVSCIAIIWVGWSPIAVVIAVLFYALRMVGITAFYHRYFAHKTF